MGIGSCFKRPQTLEDARDAGVKAKLDKTKKQRQGRRREARREKRREKKTTKEERREERREKKRKLS